MEFGIFHSMEEEHTFDDLVTIARFQFPYQAHLLAGRLESEGIMAFVQDENQIAISPWLTNTLGGVRVQVRTSDEVAANEIMQTIEASVTPEDTLHPSIEVNGKVFDLVNGICPECSTASVYLARPNGLTTASAAAFVVTFMIPIKLQHKYFCFNCHYEWNG
jgi:hypothetical protein